MMSPSSVDEEIGTGNGAVVNKKHSGKSYKMGRYAGLSLLFLATFSGFAVYSHSTRLGRVERKLAVSETAAGGGDLAMTKGFVNEIENMSSKRRLDNDTAQPSLGERMVAVLKSTWPACVDNRMNGVSCKNFIDEEILTLFTGVDRLTRTIIFGKRSIYDVFYNTVVILMDDGNHVVGRDGDGMIYYDFDWLGSGRFVTPEEEAEIPPIIATETNDGLIFENQPVLVEGCTVEGAMDTENPDQNPCAGGVVVDPNIDDLYGKGCPTESFSDRIANAQLITVVPAAGERALPAFDCSCLTGFHCCLLIKASVRDADVYNKAIQCHLNYTPESDKHHLFHDGRGKVVNIYTNHNFVVSQTPYVEGSWPAPWNDDDATPNDSPSTHWTAYDK